jgi:hypothetical protein
MNLLFFTATLFSIVDDWKQTDNLWISSGML